MASRKAFFGAWKIIVLVALLLLLAFNVSSRELNVMADIARENGMEVKEKRSYNQVLDRGWKGNYHPPNKFKDEP
ncbi:hypothetical protein IC582_012998 [Cucumis melo]